MNITKLKLIDFRNQKEKTVMPTEGVTVFTGPNGCGKTNLLEAMYTASLGKSFRTSQMDDLIRFDSEEGAFFVDFTLRGQVHSLRGRLTRGRGVQFFMNETKIRRKDLIGTFRTVLFTPDSLMLIKGAPQERRRFLDLEVSQVSPRYYEEILRYNRALAQRNAALRQAQIQGVRPDIDMWDMQIAQGAAYIVKKRLETVERMNRLLPRMEAALTGNEDVLTVKYVEAQGDGTAKDESWYLERLAASRDEDARLCRTSVGPHRDDLQFLLSGHDIARFGSQGQQRTAILAMKLAEMEFIQEETGEYPVLLLDDIGSELDEKRRGALFDFLSNAGIQAFVTAAEYRSVGVGKEIQIKNEEGRRKNFGAPPFGRKSGVFN